jgi:mRNA interferase HigB
LNGVDLLGSYYIYQFIEVVNLLALCYFFYHIDNIYYFYVNVISLRIIAKRTLREFWELNPDSKQQLLAWYREASKANWNNPNEIKQQYAKASILKNDRAVFDISDNKYRLVA